MSEIQGYLKDLLTIDCDIQASMQHLALVTTRDALEAKSADIKRGLRLFKAKLAEMKDYCDASQGLDTNGFMGKLANRVISHATSLNDYTQMFAAAAVSAASATTSTSATSAATSAAASASAAAASARATSPREIFVKELQIQKEHLFTIETRFRNAYLAAQIKLEQTERDSLFRNEPLLLSANESSGGGGDAAKKRNVSNQVLMKQSTDMTTKLSQIHKQLKWTESQTSDIIPVLDNSSKTLQNTQQEFGFMRTVITDGHRLLIRLSRREFTDKLLTILCLCFFFSVVFYIVWKRLF